MGECTVDILLGKTGKENINPRHGKHDRHAGTHTHVTQIRNFMSPEGFGQKTKYGSNGFDGM